MKALLQQSSNQVISQKDCKIWVKVFLFTWWSPHSLGTIFLVSTVLEEFADGIHQHGLYMVVLEFVTDTGGHSAVVASPCVRSLYHQAKNQLQSSQ
jgi:hypothetical protein